MGITEEMTEDESIRFATQSRNVMAIGWDPAHGNDMTVFSIGLKVDDDGQYIINAVASLAMNVFRQMARGDMKKELELTSSMISALAERQAAEIADSVAGQMTKTDSVTS